MRENLKTYLAGQKSEYFRRDRDVRFLVQALGRVLHDFAPHTDADLQWIQDEIMAQIDPKLKTKLEAMDVGGLVALLVVFGSSVEQAKEAVAQWYLISEKTARDSYNLVLKDFGIRNKSEIAGNRDFRMTYVYEPSAAARKLGKPFPTEYPAALGAYQSALKAEKEYAAKGPKSFTSQGA